MADQTLGAILRQVRAAFAQAGIDGADLDARLIVEHCSGTTRTDSITDPGRELAPQIIDAIEMAVARRLSGEPVHRILGFREFYGLKLHLSPETLEPRPDTETLVDAVLPFAEQVIETKGTCRILDLGTGTGAIALALLHEAPKAEAVGVDISDDALETANENARRLGLGNRFSTVKSSWFEKIEGRFDVIVSNPPYIRSQVIPTLQREVRDFDPIRALDGGADGLDTYRVIATEADRHLVADGIVAVEIGFDQAAEVEKIFAKEGHFLAQKHLDLEKYDRILVFLRSKNQVLRP
ncbi:MULTISPECIES: peptide chain release factor N(5)-glutamine methyltransferase [Mesorhizobium]|uniref:Release factor glutamine methyltransferase n=1 Tax=Mesorhizobium denitrificans TaxID=2294114 RepID=A0A371XFG7_9HYPH|nr:MULTISPECIES: peptide chain release factor N(5)-glutamine methyltransferase [Mesorhizobium]RFC67969.1 peptide chain release factor N(5)-glutamine methyltransferase [Mesorhizobium denitrificans]